MRKVMKKVGKRCFSLLKDKRGNMFPLTVVVAVILLILMLVIMEYMKLMILCSGVKDSFEEAIISVVNDNYNEVYHCVREGYAAGYEPNGDETFYASIDSGDVAGRLSSLLGLEEARDSYRRVNRSGDEEYTISHVSVTVHNAPMVRSGEKFYTTGTLHLSVPVRFGGNVIFHMPLNLSVRASLDERF